MEILSYFIDLLSNFDKHLTHWCATYGPWAIAILAFIVFAETGLLVFPFLPGDSMLFIIGVFCGANLLDYSTVAPALIAAAVLGDALNYRVGYRCGMVLVGRFPTVAQGHAYAQRYFERHGPKTIIIARFIPLLRTFAPFAAGFGRMEAKVFTRYNVGGASLWVISLTALGLVFGDLEIVRNNLSHAILAIVALSLTPLLWVQIRKLSVRPQ